MLLLAVALELKKEAKSRGGDRYSGAVDGESMDVYIPQCITRVSGPAKKKMVISFYTDNSADNSFRIKLAKAAKSSGGDKYEGDVLGESFTPYIPQIVSRVGSGPRPHLFVAFGDAAGSSAKKAEAPAAAAAGAGPKRGRAVPASSSSSAATHSSSVIPYRRA
jgi:hypothetical protein